jgi:hypothetical protein
VLDHLFDEVGAKVNSLHDEYQPDASTTAPAQSLFNSRESSVAIPFAADYDRSLNHSRTVGAIRQAAGVPVPVAAVAPPAERPASVTSVRSARYGLAQGAEETMEEKFKRTKSALLLMHRARQRQDENERLQNWPGTSQAKMRARSRKLGSMFDSTSHVFKTPVPRFNEGGSLGSGRLVDVIPFRRSDSIRPVQPAHQEIWERALRAPGNELDMATRYLQNNNIGHIGEDTPDVPVAAGRGFSGRTPFGEHYVAPIERYGDLPVFGVEGRAKRIYEFDQGVRGTDIQVGGMTPNTTF